jgi:hypothetical protein
MHGTAAWAPVSGKADVAWLNVAGVQAMVVWQDLHSVGNPPATCAGFVVFWKSVWWQSKQIVDVPVKRLFTWHCMHGTAAWAPVSGKADVAWLNVAGVQAVVVWHTWHSDGKTGVLWTGFRAEVY